MEILRKFDIEVPAKINTNEKIAEITGANEQITILKSLKDNDEFDFSLKNIDPEVTRLTQLLEANYIDNSEELEINTQVYIIGGYIISKNRFLVNLKHLPAEGLSDLDRLFIALLFDSHSEVEKIDSIANKLGLVETIRKVA